MTENSLKRDSTGSKTSLTSLEVRFAKSALSGSRRRLIREILDNHEQTFFLSSREMAKRYNVNAATIVRTVQAGLRALCRLCSRPAAAFRQTHHAVHGTESRNAGETQCHRSGATLC